MRTLGDVELDRRSRDREALSGPEDRVRRAFGVQFQPHFSGKIVTHG
jgi:hypothetical protein